MVKMKCINQLSIQEVAAALNIYERSAQELLDGTISIKMKEVKEIAEYKGLTTDEILSANQGFRVMNRKQ